MPHPSEHGSVDRPLSAGDAEDLAETLKALGSPGRLGVLVELLAGDRTVEQLAAAAELSPSATSHHLRLLRSRCDGRNVVYALHDHHIVDLLAAVRHHHEHVHPPAPVSLPATRAA